jgi:flagellar hook assembly protein FlgD
MLDYPDTLDPVVEIYSLGGALVKQFSANQINNKRIFWDGRNEDERDVASGLYFVIVKENGFKKIGKIARQR